MPRPPNYVELRSASAFSFLEGASLPEDLAETAAGLSLPALALLDRDGVYGAPRFYKAAKKVGVRPIVGSEVTLSNGARLPHEAARKGRESALGGRSSAAAKRCPAAGDPALREEPLQVKAAVPLLVESRTGYENLCRLLTRMHLRSSKGEGSVQIDELEEFAPGLVCLTGGANGPLSSTDATSTDAQTLERLLHIFGRDNVFIELNRHYECSQENLNRRAIELAERYRLPVVATNAVRYATPAARPIADVFTCLRHHVKLDTAGRLLSLNSERHLKSAAQMAELFRDIPEAVANTVTLAQRLEFTLENLGYEFPRAPVPPGETMTSYLRQLTDAGARQRYRPLTEKARRQIERELELIERLHLEGYFLIVHDIVRFCREHDILAQGRGSAANSAVCYSLGITAVDPVGMELLFERFLSEERGEWPDIDIDLPSGDRRERVIQHVYERYGRWGAAMTANVITYRGRSAAREVGKVLDFPEDMIGRLSHLLGIVQGTEADVATELRHAGFDPSNARLLRFLELCGAIQDLPRHLGQHSGGMVICQGALDRIVPLENASMPGRVVVQWDKDDCADLGIIKVDLLGLGMMSLLQDALAMINRRPGAPPVDLAHLPPDDPEVYRTLQAADTIGIFQVESRAQMATLPRLRPERFYDLVIEVALIRPGPIVGDLVHPYLRRRAGKEPVRYAHPSLEPILKRTLGVPLFQEQLLRMAMTVAGFSGGEAEELRRAFGFKRSEKRMKEVEVKLREGMARQGITGPAADEVVHSITSFALYGFPESHSASFALLVYASAYIKVHYPAEFYAAILNNQPMGFYHPATLVKDAQRHGVRILPISITDSDYDCRAEDVDGIPGVRLGFRYVSELRQELAMQLEVERRRQPFASADDLRQRVRLNHSEIRRLAEIGALRPLGMKRREALWQIERAWRPAGPLYDYGEYSEAGWIDTPEGSPLTDMTAVERMHADFRGTRLTVGPHPLALRRAELRAAGVLSAAEVRNVRSGRRVQVAGVVIARQRPSTAKGIVFLSLEDETGIANVIVPQRVFAEQRLTAVSESMLRVEGVVQSAEGVVNVRAERLSPLTEQEPAIELVPSHDFH